MNLLSLIPFPAKLIALLTACALFVGGLIFAGYRSGAYHVQAKWDAEKIAIEQQAENNRLLRQGAINKIDSKGTARAKKQAAIDKTILEKVETNVPLSLPMLPGSFRLQHDAAATGEEVSDTGQIDASPVAPRDVAKTISINYAEARANAGNLEDLQEIVRKSGCFDIQD